MMPVLLETNTTGIIDTLYPEVFKAYLSVKSSLVFTGILSVIGGIVMTALVFKIAGIVKEMLSEGKGFSAKHFFELCKQYIMCMGLIVILPPLITALESLFGYASQELVSTIIAQGAYRPNDAVIRMAEDMLKDNQDLSFSSILFDDPLTAFNLLLVSTVGSIAAWVFQYITYIFISGRYLILLLFETIAPIGIICLLHDDTRNSFYTWIKGLFGCYMLYPGLIIASYFADLIILGLAENTDFPNWILLCFALSLKTSLLSTTKSTISKWL